MPPAAHLPCEAAPTALFAPLSLGAANLHRSMAFSSSRLAAEARPLAARWSRSRAAVEFLAELA